MGKKNSRGSTPAEVVESNSEDTKQIPRRPPPYRDSRGFLPLGVFRVWSSLPAQTPQPRPLPGICFPHAVFFLPLLVDFLPNHFPPGSKLLSGKK